MSAATHAYKAFALKDNLVKVSSIYQFEDNDKIYSIVLGRFCEGWSRNEGRHILPPWKKEIKGLQKM